MGAEYTGTIREEILHGVAQAVTCLLLPSQGLSFCESSKFAYYVSFVELNR